MTIVVCDRCKKEIAARARKFIYRFDEIDDDEKMDLCFECYTELKDVLNRFISKTVDDIKLSDADLSVRTYHCLIRYFQVQLGYGYTYMPTLGDVANLSSRDLMKVRNFGKHSMDELIIKLHYYGLKLKDERDSESEPPMIQDEESREVDDE